MPSARSFAPEATILLAILLLGAVSQRPTVAQFDEITVHRINVIDSTGRTRVLLAGGYPPRRESLAGLLFINEDGQEAGGLVYAGTRNADGEVEAGGILTFDQYRNDQVVALEYSQSGGRKREGLTIQDRPDTLSDRVKEFYRSFEQAPTQEARDSIRAYYLSRIPRAEFSARRLFAGRDDSRASVVTLADPSGRPRLRLEVDSLGQASIAFLDEEGNTVRTIRP